MEIQHLFLDKNLPPVVSEIKKNINLFLVSFCAMLLELILHFDSINYILEFSKEKIQK